MTLPEQDILYIIIAFCTSLGFSLIGTPFIIMMCKKKGLYDMPDARKVHKFAIPRLGGALFMPSMCIGIVAALAVIHRGLSHEFTVTLSTVAMASGGIVIYLIGILDDLKGMKAMHKFIIQAVVASFFPLCNLMINDLHGLFGLHIIPCFLAYPLTVFVILLIVNAMNLIDGIDGLASSLSICILCTFSWLYSDLGSQLFCLLSIALAGAVAGFFCYNYYGKIGGNKIFMGDSGSLFLGYVISYLAIKYQMTNWQVFEYRENSFLISFTLVMLPCFDVIRVAIGRRLRGKKMFDPDKTHIHHIIMATGLGMHQTLLVILLTFGAFCVINYGLFIFGLSLSIIMLTDVVSYLLLTYFTITMKED
ncbi:MAG: undecaprenyl/decaprenyl-phosphate alpha-N-acetylglucosaminyl 1-phosphate transferase [Bacteroidaceae bacterium]|nr:undecaprenyl/decaprenyl-phosphate alpha-N-acetylglucosaminyl 1-phosphate transferase [Bacteroidaceae bacterium]